ncbi:agamous-like MADS-box protein AGL80 [Brachypodium distachyon]|uniref:MADS-box domain-containing protein n=1 Tax=Brachypodium distachyon TaxID=15368 RepID=A0A0Q3J4I9_BRADI|nr:agamous-like MADS-box protein AGL80 [Brachypodium distachyon]KQK07644.1 hypothetical protein BRADI_2g36774v3 [Brachypodium distachyon]|eukprot:XP_010233354.1 agamous-like MADS-box protein AGL80 [Brachypodium distachyon]
MARGVVRMEYIENESKRKTTMKRRLKSLVKKVSEISILCDVMALLVVYRPGEQQPAAVWPPTAAEAIAVAGEYKSLNSEKLKKPLDRVGFARQQVEKERTRLLNFHRASETRSIIFGLFFRYIDGLNLQGLTETPELEGQLGNLTAHGAVDVQCQLQSTLRAVSDRLRWKRSGSTSAPPPQQQGMLPPAELEAPVAPQPQQVGMVDNFIVAPPAGPDAVPVVPLPPAAAPMAPMEMDPPHNGADDASMGMILDVLKDYDGAGNGSVLPNPEEVHDALVRTGILAAPPPPNGDSASNP